MTPIPASRLQLPSERGWRETISTFETSNDLKHFNAIAAMSENRVIGNGASIPWYLPEDFRWFREKTTGHVLVMGRKTFESIGRPLPKRKTIVLSRSGFSHPDVEVRSSLESIRPEDEPGTVFVCGGGEIYRQALPRCSNLYLTHVKRHVNGDVFFPEFENAFECVEILRSTPDFEIRHYRNRCLED